MNWFKGTARNPKVPGGSTPTDSVDKTSDATGASNNKEATGDSSASKAETPAPTASLDDTQAWLKSLEPKANPKFVALKRELHQKVISNLDIGSMAR